MRIALIIERMDVSRGGRETSTAQMATALAAGGHDVTILCQRGGWRSEGVIVRELGRRGLLRLQRLGNFVADASAAIREGEYDIAHAMLPVPGANVYQPRGGTIPGQVLGSRRMWGWLGAIRVGLFERLNLCRRKLAALERRLVADRSVTCLAVSEMVAEEFSRHFGRSENVHVVYNGVAVPAPDSEKRADDRQRLRYKLGIKQQDVVFLTLATNFSLKGVAHAISAFARWYHRRRGDVTGRLVVVGRHSPEGYQRVAGMREVGKQVVFVPPVDDPFEWYAAADVCVLLSWYDPCSRVVLEAARWGIPSITTVHNGAAEALAEGAGLVVDSPRNVKAVADAMDSLTDPAQRARRAEACRQVAERLSIQRHADGLLEAYSAVARRPG